MLTKQTDAEEGWDVKRGWQGLLLLSGLVALAGAIRQRLRAEASSDNWVSSYTPAATTESRDRPLTAEPTPDAPP